MINFKKIARNSFLLTIASIYISTQTILPALAQDAGYDKLFNQQYAPYYDPNCNPGQSSSDSSENVNIGSVYMVGDSIAQTAKDHYKLEKKFKDKDIEATIVTSGGSGLDHPGTDGNKKSGIQSIQDDGDKIKNVDAVIIAHGTNNFPGELEGLLKKAIREVKKHNNSAKIFWINTDTNSSTGDTRNGEKAYTAASAQKKNQIIDKQAELLDYSVIDVKTANIPLNSDGIHPEFAEKGMGKWGDTVVDGVLSGSTNGSSELETDVLETASCCPAGSGGSAIAGSGLTGDSNAEKAFNFFIGKGLSPEQAAGIVGNAMQESGGGTFNIEPTLAYGGRKVKSPPSTPWGIVQWNPGTKLKDFADQYKIDGDVAELETQLNVIWEQINDKGAQEYLIDDLKKLNSVDEATILFEEVFERSGGSAMTNRIQYAKKALQEFGEGAPGSSSGSSTDATGCVCQDPSAVGDVSGANPENLGEFVKKYADSALAAAKKAGIPYDAMLAQIAHESGLPLSELASKYNNFGGIKYTGKGKSTPPMATQEEGQGTIMARFRAFDTAEEGLYQQAMFFVENSRYRKALNYPRNPSRFIDEVAKAGYATDSSYASKVKGMLKEVQKELLKQGKPLSKDVQPERQPSGGDLSDAPVSAADCSGVSGGVVIDGFAFPVGGLKQDEVGANSALPCRNLSGGCHHDGTSAFDLGKAGSNGVLGSESEGLPVYAIEDGVIKNFRTTYNGRAGCPSFQLKGQSGWWYWYGHTKKAKIREGSRVKAGEKIAEIGPSRCASDSPPHLHIDRGTPKGHYGGSVGARDPSINELINKLWEALP